MEVILDTNFIISCMRKRIDFLGQFEELGFKVRIPKEVFQELKDLRTRDGQSHEVRMAIDTVMEMFANKKIRKISLGGNKVDEGLINKGKEGVYIATLDKGILNKVPNKVIIRDAKGRIELVRD